MVMLEIQEEVQLSDDGLDITLSQELADLLDEAEVGSVSRQPTQHWYYRMPFPGVRYYSYEERSAPVGG